MATAQVLRDIEDDCPWLRADFRAGLAALSDSTAEQARRFAADMRLLAALTAQVPRCPADDRGATPWTSFRREVAVARRLSDQGAAAEIRAAVLLTGPMPATLELLTAGRITVQRARAFVTELEGKDDAVVAALDARLAERVAALPLWRIKQETRRAVLKAEPDEAARRTAEGNAARQVRFQPEPDDQATVVLSGPAVPLTRYYGTLNDRARTIKAAGDPRTLDQIRFDLAVSSYPCAAHVPSDPRDDADQVLRAASVVAAARSDAGADTPGSLDPASWWGASPAHAASPAGDAADARPSFVEPAGSDCRLSRPVQANVTVPVETALGLSNEPGWLDGYGWLSAPTCRLLLVDAELRRVCVQAGTGQVVDVAERDMRPPPTYAGLRHALVDMVVDDIALTGSAGRVEDDHDPSPWLRELVELRDRFDDGPTGTQRAASGCELDHEIRFPEGPTAAWNLAARAARTHQLKHYGWTPLRTPTTTLWFSPAGQVVEVPRHLQPPPGADPGEDPRLPDAERLAATDLAQLQPSTDEDAPPWLPAWLQEPWLAAGDAGGPEGGDDAAPF